MEVDPPDTLGSAIGYDPAEIVVEWLRQTIYHGRHLIDHNTGMPVLDPWIEDVPVIPVEVIAEGFADRDIPVPTRQEVRDFAEADGSTDPEIELLRAKYAPDPDPDAAAPAWEKRINGVPESVYNARDADARAKVDKYLVIAPPQSPTAVARWLVREMFSHPITIPTADGSRPRHQAWMPTVVRIDQVLVQLPAHRAW